MNLTTWVVFGVVLLLLIAIYGGDSRDVRQKRLQERRRMNRYRRHKHHTTSYK